MNNEIVAERERKRSALADPYPLLSEHQEYIAPNKIGDYLSEKPEGKPVVIAGRVIAKRGHGKVYFLDIRDDSGTIQVLLKIDLLTDLSFAEIEHLDLGDIIGVQGETGYSKRGEYSITATSWKMLAKALLPPPDKHAGLEDTETRFRNREIDLIANETTREVFYIRSKTVSAIRRFLDNRGFLEVETPVLQPVYGGAAARPFTTHHNALDQNFYLRIATELYLKRCIIGGFDAVYELGKDFRNEGISPKHNPEFTMLEYYQAYADYRVTARDFKQLIQYVAEQVLMSTEIEVNGETINLSKWQEISFRDAILDYSGHDINQLNTEDKLHAAIGGDKESWAQMADRLFSDTVEPHLIQPTLITDYPEALSPFAKSHPTKPGVVERWEAFIGGMEIANSFTELNDPEQQKQRLLEQDSQLKRGDDQAQPFDADFIDALKRGMPPTGGVGLGIDRLVMLLTNSPSLREVILFPAMRNKD